MLISGVLTACRCPICAQICDPRAGLFACEQPACAAGRLLMPEQLSRIDAGCADDLKADDAQRGAEAERATHDQ